LESSGYRGRAFVDVRALKPGNTPRLMLRLLHDRTRR
jgi:hypothetical protein